MSRKPPRPPNGLGPAGRKLFRRVCADLHPSLEFDAKDLEAVERAAVCADLVEDLRADLRTRGTVVEGSTGRMMTNPSIDKIGAMQTKITRILATVRLEPEPVKTGGLGVKQRNRIRRDQMLSQRGPVGGAIG